MLEVSTVLVLLCLVTFLAFLTRTWSIPYPTIMVLVGAAIAFVPGLPHVQLTPEIVFLVFLPPPWRWRLGRRSLSPALFPNSLSPQ